MAPYHSTNPSVDADMDNLLDFNGGGGLQSPSSPVDLANSMMAPEHADERQGFSGPSHQYDLFPQQTGFPSGSMSTVASFNDMTGDNDFMSPGSSFGGHSSYGPVDMGYNPAFNLDMDYEATPRSNAPAYFFPGVPSDSKDFGEPSSSSAFEAPPTNPQRLWPGAHSEQARQEASARQQRRQQQQQHYHQQGQQVLPQRQRELSSSAPQEDAAPSQTSERGSQATKEERGPPSNGNQVNMASHTSLDLSMLNLGNNHWSSSNSVFTFQQPQVFAVLEVPEAPLYSDQEIMAPRLWSGKQPAAASAASAPRPSKRSGPRPIEFPVTPTPVEAETGPSTTCNDIADLHFALYADAPTPCSRPSSVSPCTIEVAARILNHSLSGKHAPTHFPMVVAQHKSSESLCEEVQAMFGSLESSLSRIKSLTWHLPRS